MHEQIASSHCPICGFDEPHTHNEKDLVEWIKTQISRFGFNYNRVISELVNVNLCAEISRLRFALDADAVHAEEIMAENKCLNVENEKLMKIIRDYLGVLERSKDWTILNYSMLIERTLAARASQIIPEEEPK